jgi:hypothetical protein
MRPYKTECPIFIHVPKTGGSYLGRSLFECGVDYLKVGHHTASQLAGNTTRFAGIDFHNRFSFACVRNPYSRFLSACRFNKRVVDFEQHSINLVKEYEKNGLAWPDRYTARRRKEARIHFHTQKEMLSDHNGEILVNYIGRFEQFDGFIQGLAENGLDITSIYEYKAPKGLDWETALSELTKENIRLLYAEDFSAFGYDL